MINVDYFTDKRVAVVGLGRSGLASANLLYDLGAEVFVTDNQDNEQARLNVKGLKSEEIEVELGRHTQEFIKDKDMVVVSPGVAKLSQPILWAQGFKIPIISEIELAWRICPATVIAITGSSGKTTVTTMLGRILEEAGKRVFVCGNIGNPFCQDVYKMQSSDFVSLEVSSFQLEWTKDFKPKIAVMLNFSRNHLDRHADIQEYLQAKKRIFMNQEKDDFLVLNLDEPVLKGLSKEAKSKVIFFEETKEFNPNQAAVVAVGDSLGIDKNVCLQAFKEFKGLEHRLEYVAQIKGVKFINDSKATLVESTGWAIKNISSPIILIAGGKDKGVDYAGILNVAKGKVKEVILIGQAKDKIEAALKGYLPIDKAASLEGAVRDAYLKAKPGDCVLLSPMCSSFDMFSNYEERGNVFKSAVKELVAGVAKSVI